MNFDTNCVFTETGFPGSEVTQGLISGVGTHDGRLKEPTSITPDTSDASSAGCAPDGTTAQWDSGIRERGTASNPVVLVNNDILSCFFLNDTTTVGSIAQPDATFPSSARHSLSPEIFKSPRFLWVPVFADQPASGAGWYKVIGWRPAFITDQPPTATRANRQVGAGTINGIKLTSNGKAILGMKVVFFNGLALPDSMAASGPNFEYTGTGTRVITLVE
jgi:hypothetical protein